jgi:uncharacterized OB-fold protein
MPRKLPEITALNAAFWQSGQTGTLKITRCQACTNWLHPPAAFCPQCESRDIQAEAVSGRATIASFTVNYQPWTEELTEPYVVAIVELEEQAGLQFISNIIDAEPDSIAIGQSVEVVFEHIEDVWLPLFRRTGS